MWCMGYGIWSPCDGKALQHGQGTGVRAWRSTGAEEGLVVGFGAIYLKNEPEPLRATFNAVNIYPPEFSTVYRVVLVLPL